MQLHQDLRNLSSSADRADVHPGSYSASASPVRPVATDPASNEEDFPSRMVMVGIGLLAHPGRIGAAIDVLGELSAGVLSESGDLDATLVLVDSTTRRSGRSAESTVVLERRVTVAMAQARGVADRLSFIDGPLAAPVQMGFLDQADIFISPLTIDGQVVAGGLTFAAAEGSTSVSTHGRGRKGPVMRDPELVAQLLVDMVSATRNRLTSFDGRRHPVFGDSASVDAVDATTEVALRVMRAG